MAAIADKDGNVAHRVNRPAAKKNRNTLFFPFDTPANPLYKPAPPTATNERNGSNEASDGRMGA
ncbi:hypothetical protein [Niveispirillum sp. SYP-B3756]|uniref:hypothetical protein n=1 Tax=Niveispirillum sp. SYP-B3756 TaxID=2662178 RepID=UPI0015650152|nr:hypothetical protein [Niveispirillum sp. SYP-B3756]